MRAVTLQGTELVIAERAQPVCGPEDVLVAAAGAGLNAADLLQRQGFYPAPPGSPADIPGLEVAGVVVALGSAVHSVDIGDRVCAVLGGGGQASECVIPAEHLIPVPDHVDLIAAGGFAEAFSTAHDALITQATLAPGERVCISGAAGGVGVAAIQIAKWRGAHVTAATRDESTHDVLRALGADACVTTAASANAGPYDVLLELVGAAHFSEAQRALGPHARVVIIGVGGGGRVDVDLLAIMTKRLHITGSTLRARSRSEKAAVAAAVRRDLVPAWERGELQIPLAGIYPMVDAAAAYDAFSVKGKVGKIVLALSPSHAD